MTELPESYDLERALHATFGFDAFRPGQRALVEAVLEGRDALGVMPTGGGKSLAFQLPATLLPGTAVVVSPLIALMKDQVTALRARGIPAAFYNSTLGAAERRTVEEDLRRGRLRLLYIAPERIQQEDFMAQLGRMPVSLLAIDEAHCISHWGHDFRPDYRRLAELRRLLRGPGGAPVPVIALTATATSRVQEDIVERLGMADPARVITGFRRPNLSFEVRRCGGRADKLQVLEALLAEALTEGGSAVIYASTRKNVERAAEGLGKLAGRTLRVGYYHAGLPDEERTQAQERFLRGEYRVLVATNAFGMGIDKPDVRLVAHHDIPGSVEAYYQEAGRAGRDGAPARCVLLFNYADVATQEFLIARGSGSAAEEWDGPPPLDDEGEAASRAGPASRDEHATNQTAMLRQLVRYAYANTCRQGLILGYFGDEEAAGFSGCGLCDVCRPSARERVEVDEPTALAARQALAAVARLPNRFGKARIAELLKGSQSAAFLATGLQGQSTYGLLSRWPLEDVRGLLDILLDDGYLRVNGLEYPVLGISPEGVRAMKGEAPLAVSRPLGAAAKRGSLPREPGTECANPELLAALKAWRREESGARKVPAYVVFPDRTLEEIAARVPTETSALDGISGIGPKKLVEYGEKVVAIARRHAPTAGSGTA